MPLFVVTCLDHEGALERRLAVREAHLAFLDARQAMVRLAGPLLDDAGAVIGSLLIVEAEDRPAVEAFAAEDPYSRAGLFRSTEIRAWRVSVGALT